MVSVLLVAAMLALLPRLVQDPYLLTVLALAHIQALVATSWDVVGGEAGQVSLGHALPFGAAAYATAALTLSAATGAVALVLGLVAGLLAATVQSLFALRLHGVSLALATLALAEGTHELAGATTVRIAHFAVGGEGGIAVRGITASPAVLYEVTLLSTLVGLAIVHGIRRHRVGLVLRALRDDPVAAEATGVSTSRAKMLAFAIAGVLVGTAGTLQALVIGRAAPSMLSLETSFAALAVATAGRALGPLGPAVMGYALGAGLPWVGLSPGARMTAYAVLLIAAVVSKVGPWRRQLHATHQ